MAADDFGSGFQDFLDRISIGFFRSSVEGQLIRGNRAVAQIFGFDSFEQMKHYPLSRFYTNKKDRGRLIQTLVESGKVEDRRIAFRRQDDASIWCSVTASGVTDDNGNLVFIDGAVRDITQTEKRRQERFRRERLQGVLEMAGGVVHRLNQPLTVVNNLLNELLSDTPPGSATSNKLLQIREQVEKLNDITRKIGNIRQYKSMDYVAGVKIVDIDGAS